MSVETVSIETVTPELAQTWLDNCNEGNRLLKKNNIAYLSKNISAGCFYVTTGGCGFDVHGKLVDGQHRLHAIVRANKPVKMAVFRGLSPDAYKHIDTGIAKTPAERLRISRSLGSVASEILRLYSKRNERSRPEDLAVVADLIADQHGRLSDSNTVYFSKKSIKVACVLQMIRNPDFEPQIVEMYNGLMKGEATTPIAAVWIAQYVRRTVDGDDAGALFCRGMMAFDPNKFNATSLVLTDKQKEMLMSDARKTARLLLSNSGICADADSVNSENPHAI